MINENIIQIVMNSYFCMDTGDKNPVSVDFYIFKSEFFKIKPYCDWINSKERRWWVGIMAFEHREGRLPKLYRMLNLWRSIVCSDRLVDMDMKRPWRLMFFTPYPTFLPFRTSSLLFSILSRGGAGCNRPWNLFWLTSFPHDVETRSSVISRSFICSFIFAANSRSPLFCIL